MKNFKQQFDKYLNTVDAELEKQLPLTDQLCMRVYDAMKYSLFAGGKRIRPVLTLAVCDMFDNELKKAVLFASAVEFIHVGSLIHDDLPCMDDDDIRRGQPSCHIKYDEATAVLAGDGFFLDAFSLLARSDEVGVSANNIMRACKFLSEMSGIRGMVGGQTIDMFCEKNKMCKKTVETMHKYKTSALIRAACVLGAIAGNASEYQIKLIDEYALNLGLAFQACDDILDVRGTEKILGKPVGSDEKKKKANNVSIYGIEEAMKRAEHFTNVALLSLDKLGGNAFLAELTKWLLKRDY